MRANASVGNIPAAKRPGLLLAGLFFLTCSSAAVLACAQVTAAPDPAQGATRPATTQPATMPPQLDPQVDAILTRLEQRDVSDLRAKLTWRQEYTRDDPEDALTKRGQIWYQKARPVARFLIHFTESISGDRKDKLDEQHMFDGLWYTEIQSRTKTCLRREIRRPDDPGDPYKVGQGAFPLPFGQKKADILMEFDVTLLPPNPQQDPPDTDHLKLTPRAGTRTAESYRDLEFWVNRAGATAGLPVKVRVSKLDGTGRVDSHVTITFADVELNTGFSGRVFDVECPPGYTKLPDETLSAPAGAEVGGKP
ncbi:MAG: hypothetical protein AB1716_11265 [Planctomycetota bacterium]